MSNQRQEMVTNAPPPPFPSPLSVCVCVCVSSYICKCVVAICTDSNKPKKEEWNKKRKRISIIYLVWMKYEWSKRRRDVAAIGAPTGNVDAGAGSAQQQRHDAAQSMLALGWQQFPVFNLLLLSANELRQQTYYNLVQWLCPAIERHWQL